MREYGERVRGGCLHGASLHGGHCDHGAFTLSAVILPVLQFLEEHGVQTRVCFAGNVTRHPAFRHYFQPFAIADEVSRVCAHCRTVAGRPAGRQPR
jgi:DUF1009 family protein